MPQQALTFPRHPEVRALARLEGCTARAVALRGSLRSHLRVTVLALIALTALAASAQAQSDYPNKPITLVVPNPACPATTRC